MAKVRVLRVLEYTYDDQVCAERDMCSWSMAANGTKHVRGFGVTIKSAIITDLNFEEEEQDGQAGSTSV